MRPYPYPTPTWFKLRMEKVSGIKRFSGFWIRSNLSTWNSNEILFFHIFFNFTCLRWPNFFSQINPQPFICIANFCITNHILMKVYLFHKDTRSYFISVSKHLFLFSALFTLVSSTVIHLKVYLIFIYFSQWDQRKQH